MFADLLATNKVFALNRSVQTKPVVFYNPMVIRSQSRNMNFLHTSVFFCALALTVHNVASQTSETNPPSEDSTQNTYFCIIRSYQGIQTGFQSILNDFYEEIYRMESKADKLVCDNINSSKEAIPQYGHKIVVEYLQTKRDQAKDFFKDYDKSRSLPESLDDVEKDLRAIIDEQTGNVDIQTEKSMLKLADFEIQLTEMSAKKRDDMKNTVRQQFLFCNISDLEQKYDALDSQIEVIANATLQSGKDVVLELNTKFFTLLNSETESLKKTERAIGEKVEKCSKKEDALKASVESLKETWESASNSGPFKTDITNLSNDFINRLGMAVTKPSTAYKETIQRIANQTCNSYMNTMAFQKKKCGKKRTNEDASRRFKKLLNDGKIEGAIKYGRSIAQKMVDSQERKENQDVKMWRSLTKRSAMKFEKNLPLAIWKLLGSLNCEYEFKEIHKAANDIQDTIQSLYNNDTLVQEPLAEKLSQKMNQ